VGFVQFVVRSAATPTQQVLEPGPGWAAVAARNGEPDAVLGDLYPFEDRYARLGDGTTMHYVEWGAGWRKPTVLLLHGNPMWSFLYRDWIRPLSKVARVVAVDHVGFGRSDHPTDPRYHTVERHIRNLEEFAAEAGLKRVVPVVQDWGGPIGLGYATRHVEDMAGLVVMNTGVWPPKAKARIPLPLRILRMRGVGEWLNAGRNMTVETFIPRLVQGPVPAAVMAGYRHPFPTRESRTALVQSPRMIPDAPDHPSWAPLQRIADALPKLDVPASIYWGTHDPVFPKSMAWRFTEALPRHPQPVFLDGAGHWPQEDVPGFLIPRVAALLRSV
jgi:haloalkane dehalogenase